jgi:hypothetical protein
MAGLANVIFPFGTYWMRKFAKVACETAEMLQTRAQDLRMVPAPE